MNTSAFMHFFSRELFAHSESLSVPEQLDHSVASSSYSGVVVIETLQVVRHTSTHRRFQIIQSLPCLPVEFIINTDIDLFHIFDCAKLALPVVRLYTYLAFCAPSDAESISNAHCCALATPCPPQA